MAELSILMVADVSPLEPHGGASRVLREQSCRLGRRGHRVEVLSRMPELGAPVTAEMDGVVVHQYPVIRSHPLAFFVSSIRNARRAYARTLADRGWDAVVFHQPLSAFGLRRVLPVATPRAYVFHSPTAVEYRIRASHPDLFHPRIGVGEACALLKWVEGTALRGCRRIVVLSDFCRQLLVAVHGDVATPVVRIPGGVDLMRFRPVTDRRVARGRLGLAADELVLFTVRNLEPRMGLDALIRAVAEVRKDLDARLVIGGQGRLRAELEALATGLGLGDIVRFAGLIPEADLPSYYQAADCFILPTRELEGFGLVTVEALACGTPVLGIVGRMTPEKDHHTFLAAVAAVRPEIPEVRALIFGDGPLRAGIEAEAGRLGLLGACCFAGVREDIPDCLAAMSVVVLSSLSEGFPFTVLEALAMARPLVATAVNGVTEIVEPGVTGILVAPRRPDLLAHAMLTLLRDPERARALGQAGRKAVEARFSVERMVERLERLYAGDA